MDSLVDELHICHTLSTETLGRLTQWSQAIAAEPPHAPSRWHLHFHRYMRSVTVTASTNIEGNPMSASQVDALLNGEPVAASLRDQLENLNYNRALDLATAIAMTETHQWQESTVRLINSAVLNGLPDDRLGQYRDCPVVVGSVYTAPDYGRVPLLMRQYLDWLRNSTDHPLVRVALLHLNLVAIHPFADGNGRTARVLSTLELIRSGVRAPELLSVETYLASHRDQYFERLRTTLGETYQPDRHSATEWVEYYVQVSTALLDIETRMDEAFPHDMGLLADILSRRGEPLDWAPVLHFAASMPIRTRDIADFFEHSQPWARALLNRIVDAGWLHQEGRTRASRWLPTDQLNTLELRIPSLMRLYEQGQTLGLEV
jgi:Fic family protein